MRIAGIIDESIVDGPGIRTVIFTQGCGHHCKGCHNPETWDYDGGKDVNVNDLIERVMSNPLVKGITISGGDPFYQDVQLTDLCRSAKGAGLEVAVYTGFLFEEIRNLYAMQYIDIIVDGPFVEAERTLDLKFRGSRNQRIIDVQKSLNAGETILCSDPRWI